MALLPRRLRGGGARAEFDWLALYRSLTRGGGPDDGAGGKPGPGELLTPASLHDVRLHGDDDDHLPAGSSSSMYWQAQQTNLEYLLYLDPDRLTWTFRQQADLPTVGDPYGGWEAPGGQLRGHFTGSLPIFKSRCRFVLLVRRLLIRGLLCDSVLPLAPRSSTCYSSLVCFRRALSERERAHVGGHAQQHPQGEDDEGGGHSLRLPEEDGHGIPLGVCRGPRPCSTCTSSWMRHGRRTTPSTRCAQIRLCPSFICSIHGPMQPVCDMISSIEAAALCIKNRNPRSCFI